MKNIQLAILAFVLASSLDGSDATTTKLKSTMRDMLSAMELIQKGGFYSNKDMMKSGVESLKEKLSLLDAKNAKTYLPKEEKYAYKFAVKREKMIVMYADDMIESLNTNNMQDALEDYTQILRQCSSCHLRIRK